jgi:hypothetical protein
MKVPFILRHPHDLRWLMGAAAATAIVFTLGCASPAPPRPPSLNLPETVNDLTADRIGDLVRLHWTTPQTTNDRLPVNGPMTAEVCRIAVSSAPSPACVPVARFPVPPGLTRATDTLPSNLIVEPPVLLAYRVQILNKSGRSAEPSPEAFAASGVAPPPVEQLRATPTRDGAMLEWQQKDNPATVELDRLPIGPTGEVIEPPPSKEAVKSRSKPTVKKRSAPPPNAPAPAPKTLQASPPPPTEVKLRTPVESADAGGTVDHTARMGDSYSYTAQRVRSITLGGHALELRSTVSPPVTVVMHNTFPPHTPSGLETVPGGATPADRSLDLSWTPNTDPDLAGYIVYRQEIDSKGVAAGTATRLNANPVVGPAYRDQTAVAGHRYAYRVTAVDSAGNESQPSEPVEETLREQ